MNVTLQAQQSPSRCRFKLMQMSEALQTKVNFFRKITISFLTVIRNLSVEQLQRCLARDEVFILFYSSFYSFFTARCYASAVLAIGLCLSVCLSVSYKSVFYRNGWTNRASFWHVSFLPPVLHCVKRKFGYLQNKGTSLWNFVLNSGLRKFRHGISIVETCYQLSSRKVDAQSDKLYSGRASELVDIIDLVDRRRPSLSLWASTFLELSW